MAYTGGNLGAPRALQIDVQGLWEAFRNCAFVILHLFVAITLAYILFWIFPVHKASEAIPDRPAVNLGILIVHAVAAIPPLIIGLIAFNPFLRRRSLKLHRWLGTVYCVGIWISAVTGMVLASANQAGIVAQLGFGILGAVWFATTTAAYMTGRRRDIPAHRRWMIRSYAITLAVVTVRPLFWFGPAEGFTNLEWVAFCSWACWVPNLILGETYLRVTTFTGKLALPKRA